MICILCNILFDIAHLSFPCRGSVWDFSRRTLQCLGGGKCPLELRLALVRAFAHSQQKGPTTAGTADRWKIEEELGIIVYQRAREKPLQSDGYECGVSCLIAEEWFILYLRRTRHEQQAYPGETFKSWLRRKPYANMRSVERRCERSSAKRAEYKALLTRCIPDV